MPYIHGQQHPDSQPLDSDLPWADPTPQDVSKSASCNINTHTLEVQDLNPGHVLTPTTRSSNTGTFSPVNGSCTTNHMLATPTTAYDHLDRYTLPERQEHGDCSRTCNLAYDKDQSYHSLSQILLDPIAETLIYSNTANTETLSASSSIDAANVSILEDFYTQEHNELHRSTKRKITRIANSSVPLTPRTGKFQPASSYFTPVLPSSDSFETPQFIHTTQIGDSIHDMSAMYSAKQKRRLNLTISVAFDDATLELLLENDPFSYSYHSDSWKFVNVDGYDDELSQLLEMEDSKGNNKTSSSPKKTHDPATVSSNFSSNITSHSPGSTILGESPKLRRMYNSLDAGLEEQDSNPAFSLEDCSSEFHVSDGNYYFQDETAEVLKRHSVTSLLKKKSLGKMSKGVFKPSLRKSKTLPNLGRPLSKGALRTLKNMELGLLSFQLPTKEEKQS